MAINKLILAAKSTLKFHRIAGRTLKKAKFLALKMNLGDRVDEARHPYSGFTAKKI